MTCKLDKFKTYDVGQVHHNLSTGAYAVQLLNPGATCPEGVFNSKKAELVVNAGSAPSLGFNVNENRPVITVPSQAFVIDYGSSFGFLDLLLLTAGIAGAFFIGRAIYRALTAQRTEESLSYAGVPSTSGSYRTSHGSSYPTHAYNPGTAPAGNTTTVVNSGPDLLTTVVLANMLSNNGGHSGGGNTTINNNGDSDDDSGSSSSNSGDDSYSSDSSSDDNSYSSDSSSDDSYSSDSSSDSSYSSDSSSDSGSSFGSDS